MDLPPIPITFFELLLPYLRLAPPWIVFSGLAGLISASSFYVVAGRGFKSLPTYLLLGISVAPLFQAIGVNLPPLPPPLTIGEVHLAFVGLGTWAFLLVARLLRL